jgi:hypothetical protein
MDHPDIEQFDEEWPNNLQFSEHYALVAHTLEAVSWIMGKFEAMIN